MPESEDRGIAVMRGVAANDNPGSGPGQAGAGGGAEAADRFRRDNAGPADRPAHRARRAGQARRRQRQRAGEGCRREIGDGKP